MGRTDPSVRRGGAGLPAALRRDPAVPARALLRAAAQVRAGVALLGLAVLVEAVWLATQPMGFVVDSLQYYQLGLWLSGQEPPDFNFPHYRAPGYPMLLVTTGVTWLGTFTGLLAAQAAMAVAMPMLVYRSMRLIAPRVAFITGLLALLSLVPFVYSKVVMTEQLYIFLQLLLIYLFVRYLACPRPHDVYLLALCALALLLTRPSANVLFLLAIGLAFLVKPRQYRHQLAALALVLVCVAGWSAVRSLWAYPDLRGTALERLGQLMLYDVYLSGSGEGEPILRADYGPASEAVVRSVRAFAHEHPQAWAAQKPERDFGAYRGDPEEFATAVLTQPKRAYFAVVPLAVQTVYGTAQGHGAEAAQRLLMQAALETMRARPPLGLAFLWKRLAGSTTSVTGQTIFFNAYVSGQYYGGGSLYDGRQPMVKATNGPATQELIATVAEYLELYPETWQARLPFEMFGQYRGIPDVLLERILTLPHHDYWLLMWDAVDAMKGRDASARLFMDTTLEAFRRQPVGITVFLDNAVMFLMGPTVWYDSGYRLVALHVPFFAVDDRGLPETLQAELRAAQTSWIPDRYRRAWRNWAWLRLVADPLLFVVTVGTFLYAWRSPARLAVLFLVLVVLYQTAVISLLYEPLVRYVDATILVLLMAAMVGVAAARRGGPMVRRG
jgi:hypothetical protein